MKKTLILASASPRRAGLLSQMGLTFECLPVDIDETPGTGEPAADYVIRLAKAKAVAGYRRAARPGVLVLGSDTSVVLDGEILGKPATADEARQTLQRLSGRSHQVMTAVALATADGVTSELSITDVTFRALGSSEIDAYCRTGEPMDKAGSYGIQGRGGIFVTAIRGNYSAVVGLPLDITACMLAAAGLEVWADWPS